MGIQAQKGRIPQESNQETCTSHLQLFSAEIKFKTLNNKKTGRAGVHLWTLPTRLPPQQPAQPSQELQQKL